ncbi:MAG TPA: M42 family metallopeptidase [Bacillota bacterium]|nr:M42 family metallopeptidase [Bacillota bacterium]
MKQFYKELVNLPGISGNERFIRNYLKEKYQDVAENIYQDKLGSIFGSVNETKDGPTVMIAGHMDEVGAMVASITDKGFIKMIPIGSINPPIMLSQNMNIIMDDGSSVPGVVGAKPPHLLRDDKSKQVTSFDDFLLDIGADSKAHAEEMGIKVGQQIVFENIYRETFDKKKIISKAWDDRFGSAMALDIMSSVEKENIPCRLYCGANVQEEVGLRGAKTSSYMIKPDFFIAVDCSPCSDTFEETETGGKLGGGFMIRFYDPRCIMHRGVRMFVEETAKENNIPFQYYKSLGGTDAAEVQLSRDGVLVCTIGMPSRYIHSSASMIHKDDYEAVKKVIMAMIKKLDHGMIEQIKKNV